MSSPNYDHVHYLRIVIKGRTSESFSATSISSSIMSYYTEEDPLLPRDNRSPEIHGSRPQSIKEVYSTTETITPEPNEPSNADGLGVGQPKRRSCFEYLFFVFGVCVTLSLIFLAIPESVWDDVFWDTTPHTIDQRVNRILTNTPLIGISSISLLSTHI
jgi:hypothetical protein